MVRGIVFPALLGLATASSWSRQKPLAGEETEKHSPFTKDYEKLVLETLKEWRVPGLSIAVVDGEHIWAEGYGIASFPSTPVTSSTLFYGASTTKAFTAAALSLLIDSGNYSTEPPATFSYGTPASLRPRPLGWDTPLAAVLGDDFVLNDAWATAHLTIEDALSHRTGMPRHDKSLARFYGAGADRHPAELRDVVRSLRYLPLNREPRSTYQYCNLMFAVASYVVETLTGGWLGDFLRERIWEPLGMRATYFSLEDALAAPEHFASGYYYDEEAEGEGRFVEVPFMTLHEVSGAGSVISNALDYARWVRCLMDEAEPLSKAGHAAIKTPKMVASASSGAFDTPPVYASGWVSASYKGHRLYMHSGGMHAYGAEVYMLPDQKYGVVTFANTAFSSNAIGEILLFHLVDEKLGIPKDSRYDWAKKWKDAIREIDSAVDSAVETLYPDVKEHLPMALPLEKYAGTYFHPGYQNVTLVAADPGADGEGKNRLVAEQPDFTWPVLMDFRHVSSEFWVAYIRLLNAPGSSVMKDYAGAQFKLGPGGEVKQLGIEWRDLSSSTVDGLIWYDKLE